MAYKVFIDTNIFLDVILQRIEEWQETELLLRLANDNKIEAHTSANNLINVIYALEKQKLSQHQIIELISAILAYIQVANTSKTIFGLALAAGFSDLEDAVQYFTALDTKGMDYFITSNAKDYKKALPQLPVITPKQFMRMYNKK